MVDGGTTDRGESAGMTDHDNRWLALYVLCAASLMIVLDTTIVNVALPSIRTDLGFSQTSLAWIVNAYTLTFGGFLLLGGRLGDLYGHRNLFLAGITLFTLASLSCGLANSQALLVEPFFNRHAGSLCPAHFLADGGLGEACIQIIDALVQRQIVMLEFGDGIKERGSTQFRGSYRTNLKLLAPGAFSEIAQVSFI